MLDLVTWLCFDKADPVFDIVHFIHNVSLQNKDALGSLHSKQRLLCVVKYTKTNCRYFLLSEEY